MLNEVVLKHIVISAHLKASVACISTEQIAEVVVKGVVLRDAVVGVELEEIVTAVREGVSLDENVLNGAKFDLDHIAIVGDIAADAVQRVVLDRDVGSRAGSPRTRSDVRVVRSVSRIHAGEVYARPTVRILERAVLE